jgi:hypothetical protein
MLAQTVLRRLVVVRRDRKDAADANGGKLAGQRDDLGGIVTARARQNRHLAFGSLNDDRDDTQMFLARKRWAFARRTAGDEKVHPSLDLALYQAAQRGLIERSIDLKWRDKGGTTSDKHCWLLPEPAAG